MSEDKKTFWGSLKGLVVEDVPEKAGALPTTSLPTPAAVPSATAAPVAPMGFPSAPPPLRPVVDEAMKERLEAAIAQSAPAGYTEFLSDFATLADVIPDEASRYRAAIKLAGKHGLTVDVILNDVDKCIGSLNDKGREFEDEMRRQVERKVGGRQQAVANIDAQIKAKQEQMAQLQAEVSQLSEQRGNEAAAITIEESKIRGIQANFKVTFDTVSQGLQELRNKISTYGKGN